MIRTSATVTAQVSGGGLWEVRRGFRIAARTHRLHIASTLRLTFYRVSPKRGSLLADVSGIVVHDHWKPYYTLTGVLHARCNAHHLRELKALIERRDDAIVRDGLAFHDAQPAPAKSRRRGRPPRRVGHNLLLRLSTRKPDVLRFRIDPRVPFTDNLAEQDARMMKVRQKIPGGFRCDDGAQDFAVVRPMLATARKQGWDILPTLTRDPERLIADLRAV